MRTYSQCTNPHFTTQRQGNFVSPATCDSQLVEIRLPWGRHVVHATASQNYRSSNREICIHPVLLPRQGYTRQQKKGYRHI